MHPDPGGNGPTPVYRFYFPRGNEWWVQIDVCSVQPVGNVSARVAGTGGPWIPLDLKPWGDWAAPMRVLPGQEVEFLACPPHQDPRCDRSPGTVRWPPS